MPDTWLGAIQLTFIDLLVVFLVLWLLAVVIKGTQTVVRKVDHSGGDEDNGRDVETEEVALVTPDSYEPGKPVLMPTVDGPSTGTLEDDPRDGARLVAVVTAAVASYMGENSVPFAVRSITPVDGVTTEAWLLAGRQRLMELRNMPARRR